MRIKTEKEKPSGTRNSTCTHSINDGYNDKNKISVFLQPVISRDVAKRSVTAPKRKGSRIPRPHPELYGAHSTVANHRGV